MSSDGISSVGLNLWIRGRRLKKKMKTARHDYTAFLLSLPKSGRTWHRLLLGRYLTTVLDLDPRRSFDLDDLFEKGGATRIKYSHNGTSFSDKLPATHSLVASPIEWNDRDCLLLVREPRDVLVSTYFHARFRDKAFQGSLSEFVRHPYAGAAKLFTALARWQSTQSLAKSFQLIRYEDMRKNEEASLLQTLAFARIANPDAVAMKEAIRFCSIENMQKLEDEDFFSTDELRTVSSDPRARKVRSGMVSGYPKYLSADDLKFIDQLEQSSGGPFFDTSRG